MPKYSFIARVPNHPGALHDAARVVMREKANINRVQFDQRIDPYIVFFEVSCEEEAFGRIEKELAAMGYLKDTLRPLNILKFYVYLPHEPGALFAFLNHTTRHNANISYIDFDDRGRHPDRLTITVSLEENGSAEQLLDTLKSRYRIEIIEYDTTGKKLDDTVFYIRFAQEIREIIGESEDPFLLSFLGDINHAVQELMNLGQDPKKIFGSFLATGRTLTRTTGDGFYADIQTIPLTAGITLTCIQPPAGGNVYLINTPEGCTMVDTGYGIYSRDIGTIIRNVIPGGRDAVRQIVITHADADHCGAAGEFPVPATMHTGTLDIIRAANRAYGSRSEASVLEEIYTTMINLFSKFNPPKEYCLFATRKGEGEAGFPVIGSIDIGGHQFMVLEGLGGHMHGQIYLFSRELGVLFTADTVINFGHLTHERAEYNTLAVVLVTSVNVDSGIARTERQNLLDLARRTTGSYHAGRKGCLVCCGHGPVSMIEGEALLPFGNIEHYLPGG
ncbi:MAG TPA: MBL fold metallo-hydrolase [Methanoregulaceae archaeon]|nr:MBL fold metallo-hydrolase [Methanoregulaceae archaeon]